MTNPTPWQEKIEVSNLTDTQSHDTEHRISWFKAHIIVKTDNNDQRRICNEAITQMADLISFRVAGDSDHTTKKLKNIITNLNKQPKADYSFEGLQNAIEDDTTITQDNVKTISQHDIDKASEIIKDALTQLQNQDMRYIDNDQDLDKLINIITRSSSFTKKQELEILEYFEEVGISQEHPISATAIMEYAASTIFAPLVADYGTLSNMPDHERIQADKLMALTSTNLQNALQTVGKPAPSVSQNLH